MKTIMISGGFDPLHIGHVRLMEQAKLLGDRLVVAVNNDNWLKKKKGFVFMNEQERAEICKAIKFVDEVVITGHAENPSGAEEMSVSKTLEQVHPDIFANGGDRDEKNANDPNSSLYYDIKTCEKLNIKIVYNVGGQKIQSSSELVKKAKENK